MNGVFTIWVSIPSFLPNPFVTHDMSSGAHYPSALGHNDGGDEAMPIEETGNMIIMALSYVQKTGDESMITTYVSSLPSLFFSFLSSQS